MRQITISDINSRVKNLKRISSSSNNKIYIESAQLAIQSQKVQNVKRQIESCVKSNYNIPISIYMELFDTVIKYGTKNDVRNIGNYITENAIPKIRDAKLTNTLIKGRITRLQNKLKPKVDNITDGLQDKLKIDMPSPAIGSAPTSNTSSNSNEDVNRDVATEAYQKMLDKNDIMAHCDRIAENYNRVSMRFNLDMLFMENTRVNGVEDTIAELCAMVDTYNMDSAVKFNTVIETAYYGLENNFIEYNPKSVLETVIDYFLFKPDGYEVVKSILESTMLYDTNDLDIIQEEEPEDEEEDIQESIMIAYSNNMGTYSNKKIKAVKEDADFVKIFNDFKKNELSKTDKPQSKVKTLFNKLYTKDPETIIKGTPDLLKWCRRFFILGTFTLPAIGPIIGCIGFAADKLISIHMDRKQYLQMLKAFNAEIKESKTKLKTTDDGEKKQKLEKYIKSLEDGRDKISSAYNDVLTDKEQDDRMEHSDEEGYSYDDDDDDFGFDFDDDDFGFDEGSIFSQIEKSMNRLILNEESYGKISKGTVERLVAHISEGNMTNLATLASYYPDLFYKDSIKESIENKISSINCGRITFESTLDKSVTLYNLENALRHLNKQHENTECTNIDEAANELDILAEAMEGISIMNDLYRNNSHLLEASFQNTLNMASMKLRNAVQKLADKDKQISQSMDVGVNSLKKGMERALTNDNRESIIKGSVLPSFSKIVKLGLANAGLVAIGQPLLAIITTLGYFAVNGKFKAKERQMVLDEIEIELKICQKYIDIAEQKNDMKALKQLLTTQRELERQRQRIKYKMQVKFGQKYYDAKAPTD